MPQAGFDFADLGPSPHRAEASAIPCRPSSPRLALASRSGKPTHGTV